MEGSVSGAIYCPHVLPPCIAPKITPSSLIFLAGLGPTRYWASYECRCTSDRHKIIATCEWHAARHASLCPRASSVRPASCAGVSGCRRRVRACVRDLAQLAQIAPLRNLRTYVRTYLRTYVHTYVRTYVRTYARTYVRREHARIRTYVRAYVRREDARTRGEYGRGKHEEHTRHNWRVLT